DALTDWADRLPGPTWVVYVVAFVIAALLVGIADWLTGTPFGEFQIEQVEWAGALVGSVALIRYLDAVALSSLDDFAPTLEASRGTFARLEFELTRMPAGPVWVLLLVGALRTAEGFLFEPASEGIVGWSPLPLAIRA